jgi:lipopolysaccharide biosynthesis regulator YciM
MEFDIWLLLSAPLFFGLGWIAARVDIKQLLSESRSLPKSYFKGLNLLLNEENDKAIDAFIEIVSLDPETLELHTALGYLFRKRGDTERAIRIHQNLLARPDLSLESRWNIQYELGQDYLKAGLFDRAEESFDQLVNSPLGTKARKALLDIFQREKEWARAIDAAEGLQNFGAGSRQKEIAQFYCEMAQDELTHTRPQTALTLLEKALNTDRNNIRATILIGDAYLAMNNPSEAITTWNKIKQQSLPHVALIAERLMNAYIALGQKEEGIQVLKSYLQDIPSIDLVEVLIKTLLESNQTQEVQQLTSDIIKRTPTLLSLDKLLDARLLVARPEVVPELSAIKHLVHSYAQRLARYQCTHCGFKARQFYWQCPGCNHWETYPPKRTEELNIMD